MPKKAQPKEAEYIEDDFDIVDSCGHDIAFEAMGDLIEASNHQTLLAIRLTKLILKHTDSKERNVDDILEIFQKASGLVSKNLPLKALLNNFE